MTVTDVDRYQADERELLCVARRHGGTILASASEVETVEGVWDASRTIIVSFDTHSEAAEWTTTQREHRRQQRRRSAITDMIVVDGALPESA
ncbi:MAG: hypothetical protein ACI8Y4_001146 [Candidatus Poriferisodalaceae bacterium]